MAYTMRWSSRTLLPSKRWHSSISNASVSRRLSEHGSRTHYPLGVSKRITFRTGSMTADHWRAHDAMRRLTHLYTSNHNTDPRPIAEAMPSCASVGEARRKKSRKLDM